MTLKLSTIGYLRIFLVFVIASGFVGCGPQQPVGAHLVAQPSPQDLAGFARADSPRQFIFPADHGPHPDFQTEWWYYTGNLDSLDGRHFGFQLTFFRRALLPPQRRENRSSNWAADQVYMAHFALTDVNGSRYFAYERLARGAAGLAGAQAQPFSVWLEDWRIERTDDPEGCIEITQAVPCSYQLTASEGDLSLDLRLVDLKGPVLQGDRGLSQKGAGPGQASYYYSLSRLKVSGELLLGDRRIPVSGWSWMDHEFSTSALSKDQIGWDWFSLQLADGSEMMVFQIRREDGSIDPFSSGTLIEPDGALIHLKKDDFQVEVLRQWKSPHSNASYPARWLVSLPEFGMNLTLEPYLADQELNVSYAYWEGAVRIVGDREGVPLSGSGYAELTGYSASMGGDF